MLPVLFKGDEGLVSRRREKRRAVRRDEGRPLGVALQEEAPNCQELLQSKAAVVNVPGQKAWHFDHVMYGLERRVQTNLRGRIETPQMTSKPGLVPYSGSSMAATCLLAMRCPVYRRRDSNSGFSYGT
jgi:hypothetical protein